MAPVRAVDGQWIRLKASPGAYGRIDVASGVVCWARTGVERLPSRLTARSRQRGICSTRGKTTRVRPCPTDACASKNPNGSPVRIWSGSTRKWPRRTSGTRATQDRSRRVPSEIARPGSGTGSVDGLCTSSQSFGRRLVFRSV